MKKPLTFIRPLLLLALLSGLFELHAQPVILNEINYDTDAVANPSEFLEFYNNSDTAVDMGGWSLRGVTYTFPSGAAIPARGYVVVAADPAKFARRWGFTPLGPWDGKLANEGERVRLLNATGGIENDVTFGVDAPWPIAPRSGTASLELVNPAADNALAGAWRSSGAQEISRTPQTYVVQSDPFWKFLRDPNTTTAPLPPAASTWRELDFNDAGWETGQTSIGFGDNDDNTVISGMVGNYRSLLLRKKFSIETGAVPRNLTLGIRVDDGCVVWINGTEVARFHTSGKFADNIEPSYTHEADNHEADPTQFEEVPLFNADAYLREGENVIAIQAIQSNINSSDFTIDARLAENLSGELATAPTPGQQNSVFTATPPPAIAAVTRDKISPAPGESVTITATVVPLANGAVGSVNLRYRKVAPGSYVRKTDSGAFTTSWVETAMVPQGNGTYTATIPAGVNTHRALVRYRVVANGTSGESVAVPYLNDPEPNFAYFVYGSMPDWSGSFDGSATNKTTYNFADLNASHPLSTYWLIARADDVNKSQFDGSYNGQRFYGTFVYNGVVYDHIQFTNRGEGSTYITGKNKWRLFFNNHKRLAAHDNAGRPYAATWDKLNLNGGSSPWAAVNRGMTGVEEAVAFRLYELCGVNAPKTHHIQFRVVNGTAETRPGSQYEGGNAEGVTHGDLWGPYLAVENFDANFLEERALADGNIYKIEGGGGDLKNDADGQPHDGTDWNNFREAGNAGQNAAWWRANMNIESFLSFSAANRIVGNVDLRHGWNHAAYHAPDGRWEILPWDLDMMFIAKGHWPGVVDQTERVLGELRWDSGSYGTGGIAELKREYQNRARELLDLVCEDGTAAGGQIGQLIDEYARVVGDPDDTSGTAATWTTLDAAMWNNNPRTGSDAGNKQTNHRGNFFKTPYVDNRFGGDWTRTLSYATNGTANFAGSMKFLRDYATNTFPDGTTWQINNGDQRGYGYQFLLKDASHGDGANAPARPAKPVNRGGGTFVLNDLKFSTSAYSGTATHAATQWRVAEISAPGIPLFDAAKGRVYEVTDVWRSGEITGAGSDTAVAQIPASVVQAGHTYRVRARHKDAAGRWSRWSPALQFVADGMPAITPQELVVSELMYNPGPLTAAEIAASGTSDRQEFEYLELLNISQRSLDLTGVTIAEGITFAFPDGTAIAPGARLLVVKNPAAFAARYGTGLPVAGRCTGNLSNSGERLVIAAGANVIQDFTFSDTAPWPTAPDGTGPSLMLMNPRSAPDHSNGANWRASTSPQGAPGETDPIVYAEWAARHPGLGNAADDDDKDGTDNLTEYALGTDPLAHNGGAASGSGSFESVGVGAQTGLYLVYTFTRANDRGDIAYAVEFSEDLQNWTADGVLLQETDNGDGTTTERWRAPAPTSEKDRLFARLRISQ